MPDSVLMELIKTLGVAAPVVGLLFYLLRQATAERQNITTEFLKTLRETVASSSSATTQLTSSVTELAALTRDRQTSATQEHSKMIEELRKISFLLDHDGAKTRQRAGSAA